MKFTMEQIARLLAAMKAYSIDDEDDKSLIKYLEFRLSILKAEQETLDQEGKGRRE